MDLNKVIEILTPEELLVEYEVRGLNATQDGVMLKLIRNIQKELNMTVAKPKRSHIKDNPEIELKAIHQKLLEIDEEFETLESSNSILEKQRFLFRITHWRDRAERLNTSFPELAEIALIGSSLNRLVRSASRDLKKFEDDLKQKVTIIDTSKPLIVSRPVEQGALGQRANSGATSKHAEPLQSEDDQRFSKQLEDITKAVMEKLQAKAPAENSGKSRFKTKGFSSYESSDEKDDDHSNTCASDSSSEPYSRNRKSREQRKSSSFHRRRPDPRKWKISFSGVKD